MNVRIKFEQNEQDLSFYIKISPGYLTFNITKLPPKILRHMTTYVMR